MKKPANIAVFASGNGSNAENLVSHYQSHPLGKVSLIITNVENAGVINRMKNLGVPCFVFTNSEINNGISLNELLMKNQIDLILLAGFLRKIPAILLSNFPDRILNIHPSLLPAFGGPGMFGLHVHRAVLRSGIKESGATVHLVNEEYDRGKILLSEPCPVLAGDTPESLAARVLSIEFQIFPKAVDIFLIQNQNKS